MKSNKSQELLKKMREVPTVDILEFSTQNSVEETLISEILDRQRRLKPSIWKGTNQKKN